MTLLTFFKLAALSCLCFISAKSPPPANPPIPIPNLGGFLTAGAGAGAEAVSSEVVCEEPLSLVAVLSRG